MVWTLLLAALLATSAAAVNLPGVPTEFTHTDAVLSAISDDVANRFVDEFMSYVKTGTKSSALQAISMQLAKLHSRDIFIKETHELSDADQFFMCTTCRATINIVARMFRADDGELNGPNAYEITKRVFLDGCALLEAQTPEVCGGLFDTNWETARYIIQNTEADSRTFCSLFMEQSFCNVKDPNYNWTLKVDNKGLPITGPKLENPNKGTETIRVLHLTDIHYDPLYEPGSLAKCPEPLCCHRNKDIAEGTSDAAGYWGDYRDCDSPWHTIESALEHIKETHPDVKYIYDTGDLVDHLVWGTSVENNINTIKKVNKKLAEMFPNTPIYRSVGNHEGHPVNVFSPTDAPENINSKWLYETLWEDWKQWLPADQMKNVLTGGYYTLSPTKGFRIISLNNNECYNMNWWLFYNGTDKQSQLEWLHERLLEAEEAGEHVHLLTHIPTGDGSCWVVHSREYNRIIERFSNTISAIFNGHTHKNELHVHHSANGHAIAVSWNGGSFTPFSYTNPNYIVYEMETANWEVTDYEGWIFNLTEANLHGADRKPNWFRQYKFSEEFTDNLSPGGIDLLLERFAETPELLRKFWRFEFGSSDPKIAEGCSKDCLLHTICRLSRTVNDQNKRCDELKAKLTIALDQEEVVKPTPAPTPEDDGAASLIAMKLGSIIALCLFVKILF